MDDPCEWVSYKACCVPWKHRRIPTLDTGGEVKNNILGWLLHHLFKRRDASLFWCFSWEPTGKLHDIYRSGNSNMGQMRFGQAKVTRATSSHRAHSLRVHPLNACTMATDVFTCLCALSLACAKSVCIRSFGCKVKVRRVVPVQEVQLEHALPSVWENFPFIKSFPLAS